MITARTNKFPAARVDYVLDSSCCCENHSEHKSYNTHCATNLLSSDNDRFIIDSYEKIVRSTLGITDCLAKTG
jgi:hypothetical protein